MSAPASLERRLSLGIGLAVTLLWLTAALITSAFLRHELSEQFDSALEETAQRILPLAAIEILGREDDGVAQRVATIHEHAERFTYVVRDAAGTVLFQSHDVDPTSFPPAAARGFREIGDTRYFDDSVLSGSLTVTMAEPLDNRRAVFRATLMALALPLLAVIPLTLLAIGLAVRQSFGPLRRLRDTLAGRGAGDLSPIEAGADLSTDLVPVVDALNGHLARLSHTFEAERAFAANAAHELRTPLAGAIAQAQRLQSETADAAARQRGADIEQTLKRLTHLSERLMQLARAEGGRLRSDTPTDLGLILRLVVDDLGQLHPDAPLTLDLPADKLLTDIDPDAIGILCRNLFENALRHGTHGTAGGEIAIRLTNAGVLTVTNDGPVIPAEVLARLTDRFARNGDGGEGTGLGLAIVRTIAERSGMGFTLASPAPGRAAGFEARVVIPVTAA